MLYEDIPTLKVFSYILADAFDASEATTLQEFLGSGKTLAELAGSDVSRQFYVDRGEDIRMIEHMWGLIEISHELNDGEPHAIVVSSRGQNELIFCFGSSEGTAWLSTEYFERDRALVHR